MHDWHQRTRRKRFASCERVVAALLAIAAPSTLMPTAHAAGSTSIAMLHSREGFIGCVDPGFTPGVVTRNYCFVARRIEAGSNAGFVSVRAWTYAHTAPGTVLTDEEIVAPATALDIAADGSFSLSLRLPRMGSVAITGVGAGVHTAIAQDEGNTSFPLTYGLASRTSSLTPYDTGLGPNYMRGGAVAGERQVELQAAVWIEDTRGQWQFSGVV